MESAAISHQMKALLHENEQRSAAKARNSILTFGVSFKTAKKLSYGLCMTDLHFGGQERVVESWQDYNSKVLFGGSSWNVDACKV